MLPPMQYVTVKLQTFVDSSTLLKIFEGVKGVHHIHIDERERVELDVDVLNKPYYGEISGPLVEVSEHLINISKEASPANTKDTLCKWAATMLFYLINYNECGSSNIVSSKIPLSRYIDLVTRRKDYVYKIFVPESTDITNNNDDAEFVGDECFKNAIVNYIINMGLTNKSISTELKHKLENTKSLADNARLFGIDNLVIVNEDNRYRAIGSKSWDQLLEDTFEAVAAMLSTFEDDILRDPYSEEHGRLGFKYNNTAYRLVSLVYNNSSINFSGNKPAKTFISEMIQRNGGTRNAFEYVAKDENSITFKLNISSDVYVPLASTLKISVDLLKSILLKIYKVRNDGTIDEKNFINSAYTHILQNLHGAGVTKYAIQAVKNKNILKPLNHAILARISETAEHKGYVFEVNRKLKMTKGTTNVVFTFRHSIPDRSVTSIEARDTNDGDYTAALLDAEKVLMKLPSIADVDQSPCKAPAVAPSLTVPEPEVSHHSNNDKGLPAWRKYYIERDSVVNLIYSKYKFTTVLTGPCLNLPPGKIMEFLKHKTNAIIYSSNKYLIIWNTKTGWGDVPSYYGITVTSPNLNDAVSFLSA